MRLRNILACAIIGSGIAAAPALAEEMKFANFMAATHPYVAGAFEPFAKAVADGTKGAVKVTLYNGGELGGGPVEQYSRVVDGAAEFVVGLPGYTASNFPITLLTELPGVITEADGTEKIWKNIDLFEPEYKRVKLVSLWSSAENVLYMREKPVHTPQDIAGLKIRVPSRNSGLLVQAWGATPVSMPVSEIYNAMQTGVIDGAMIDGTATRAFKLGEVAKYLTLGMKTTISPFFILMNRDAFDSLTPDQQAAIEAAGRKASTLGNQVQLTVAAKGIKAFGDMKDKQVIHLTADEAAAFDALSAKVVDQVVKETTDQGIDAQHIIDALKAN